MVLHSLKHSPASQTYESSKHSVERFEKHSPRIHIRTLEMKMSQAQGASNLLYLWEQYSENLTFLIACLGPVIS